MSLIKFKHNEDFGHEWYVQILNIRRWSLLQLSVSWNDYPSWPYLQIKSGTGSTLSVLFWAYKFGFDVGVIERTWNWNRVQDDENEYYSENFDELEDK
jgi:hypothetical protein